LQFLHQGGFRPTNRTSRPIGKKIIATNIAQTLKLPFVVGALQLGHNDLGIEWF